MGSTKELSTPGLPLAMSPHWSREWKAVEEIPQGKKGDCDVNFIEK